MHATFRLHSLISCAMLYFLSSACHWVTPPTYIQIQPDYSNTAIYTTGDTLRCKGDTSFYNSIRSVNYFADKDTSYISFYDKLSRTISIHYFSNGLLAKRILLYDILRGKKLNKKTTVYVKSFEDLYVINYNTLYRIYGPHNSIDSLPLQQTPYMVASSFESTSPPLFKGDTIFLSADPILDRYDPGDLQKWTVLYKINLQKHSKTLHYTIPKIYSAIRFNEKHYYNNFCYNDEGRFVFSFAADTTLYETDLQLFHLNYLAKSQYQVSPIKGVSDQTGERISSVTLKKEFLQSDAYGAIFFDPYQKRYLRILRRKINEEDYRSKNWVKSQSLIILNSQFRIIGESEIDKNVDLNTIFFGKQGEIYCRLLSAAESNNNDHLFVRLAYRDNKNNSKLGQQINK